MSPFFLTKEGFWYYPTCSPPREACWSKSKSSCLLMDCNYLCQRTQAVGVDGETSVTLPVISASHRPHCWAPSLSHNTSMDSEEFNCLMVLWYFLPMTLLFVAQYIVPETISSYKMMLLQFSWTKKIFSPSMCKSSKRSPSQEMSCYQCKHIGWWKSSGTCRCLHTPWILDY